MKKKDVVFIAREEYNNLGVGYLSATLREAGYKSSIIDLSRGPRAILRFLKEADPLIIGFSVISYGYLSEFIGLIKFLREHDLSCHFTAGGHYCSLNQEEVFDLIPELDSIVRFEGEKTIVELVRCILEGKVFNGILGLAYRENGILKVNPARPLEKNLDSFPFPVRNRLRTFFFDAPLATILAGRGCMNNCAFCNTRDFYREAGGPLKRIRQPEMVIREMQQLYRKRKCGIFMFMDDDFPVSSHEWVEKFCCGLRENKLSESVLWKICCRPDEVNEERFRLMKAHGLFLVFLGIEDGTEEGLRNMNKHITPVQIKTSLGILKKLKIGIDYGFMLFNPYTTFESLDKNLAFLEYLCGDGYMPVTFLKMIPIYKTKVEEELKKEGRFIPGIPPDYSFHEDSMNSFYNFVQDSFSTWLLHPYGLANLGRWIRNYYIVYSRFAVKDEEWMRLDRKLRGIIRESNRFLTGSLIELSHIFQAGTQSENQLNNFKNRIELKHQLYLKRIQGSSDSLYFLAIKQMALKMT